MEKLSKPSKLGIIFKGLVRSKISRGPWICWSRQLKRHIAFYPIKIEKRIGREPACQICKLLMFWKKTFVEARLLPQHDFWCPHRWWLAYGVARTQMKCGEMWIKPSPESLTRAHYLALLFDTWHRLLTPTKSLRYDWSTRFSLRNLIGWLLSDVTD